MADKMAAGQKDMHAAEAASVESFESLEKAKKKEISTLSASIEDKLGRIGELGVDIAAMKNDAGDTAENLDADRKLAADLKSNCAEKASAHEKDKKMRAEEVLALADTIKILNDDDALELFKKTLPSASVSLLQVQESTRYRLARAKDFVSAAYSHSSPR